MRRLIILFIVVLAMNLAGEPIDLNRATLEEIYQLPISREQAEAIYEYRTYTAFFKSIYDLRQISEIDQETLNKIKPLVLISHYENRDEAALRRDEIAYLIEQLGNSEGMQEGMSDEWEDYLITPRNVNRLSFANLLNMPNVSPLDAVYIRQRIARGDSIADYRDMRQTEGISYYGASNLRHYVYYDEDNEQEERLHFDVQMKYADNPYEENPETMYKEAMINLLPNGETMTGCPRIKEQSYWGYFEMDKYDFSLMSKLRFRWGNRIKGGIMYNSERGEPTIMDFSGQSKYLAEKLGDNGKYFASYEDYLFGDNFLRVIAGHYRATFGQGLVMENTDFYSARKTGSGFSKRITGITPDLSRSQEFNLKGVAAEFNNHRFYGALFYSNDKKDAVVYDSNHDGVIDENDSDVFSYITMTRRFDNEELAEAEDFFNNYSEPGTTNPYDIAMAPRVDWLEEQTIGGRFAWSPLAGTEIGVSGYESVYDKDFVVDADSLTGYLFRSSDDAFGKWKDPDSEILALYSTSTDDYERNYRRVTGIDWRTTMGNTSLEGEYAELQVDGNELSLGDDPGALVLSTYSQWDNLYLLMLYRDYDLDFDNPYARGFSEHQKFDNTAIDNYAYTLTNSLLNDLYTNQAQAQAERGIYLETRYRFHEKLTLSRAYLDIWERKCDSRKSIRFQGELDFRPIYQLSLRLKHKHQQNRYDDDAERSVSITDETTGRVIANLSNFDRISLEYRYLTVWGPPYTYLSNDGEIGGNSTAQGSSRSFADYICVDYTHHFNDGLKTQGAFMLWDSNGLSHWDWEDMEIDFFGEEGFKFWFNITDRISDNLYLSLKYKYKKYNTREYQYRAWWNEAPDEGVWVYNKVKKEINTIKLQLDYKF
ncbi:MAG: helix-hairpin-helix domain-containing protein [Candidatus Cloacimonetes bacterium]|nr:helix-hairpin-helix domain-containing protein [Candidatus Cloacimonadota bacterium]